MSLVSAALALTLALAGCAAHAANDPEPAHPGGAESAPAEPAPFDDAGANAQCGACTATGGHWFPLERLCLSPDQLETAPTDLLSFRECPGACAPGNCRGCVVEDTCDAAGCSFHISAEETYCD